MKEELRELWKEYKEECIKEGQKTGLWYEPTTGGFWHWLLTGNLT